MLEKPEDCEPSHEQGHGCLITNNIPNTALDTQEMLNKGEMLHE